MASTSPSIALPTFVSPMLARSGQPFDDVDWLFEVKWDGFRALCRRDASDVQLLQLSDGVVGTGIAFFRQCTTQGLEGMIAKRVSSIYRPGARNGDWLKIKARQSLACVVIGYEPSAEYGLRSLIIAAPVVAGELQCVGRVGSGIAGVTRERLLKELRSHHRSSPVVRCKIQGVWVEPTLFCLVSYAEITSGGNLRAPVFEKLIEPASAG